MICRRRVFTPRPDRIRTVIDVNLERPRDEPSAAFADDNRAILDQIRADVRQAARTR